MCQATTIAIEQRTRERVVKSQVELGTNHSQGKKWFEFLFLPIHLHTQARHSKPLQAKILPQNLLALVWWTSPAAKPKEFQCENSNKNCRVGILKEATQDVPNRPQIKHHRPPASSSVCIKKGCPSRDRRAQAVCGEWKMLPLQSLSARRATS